MNGSVQVATDGACPGNPGPGGWTWTTETTHASGDQPVTTNQEMELRAILEALRAHPDQPIVILTDSQYAIDCVTSWLPGWRRNGWRTSARRPVKHQPTIEAIAVELDRRPVQLVKVPATPAIRSTSAPTGSRPPRQLGQHVPRNSGQPTASRTVSGPAGNPGSDRSPRQGLPLRLDPPRASAPLGLFRSASRRWSTLRERRRAVQG